MKTIQDTEPDRLQLPARWGPGCGAEILDYDGKRMNVCEIVEFEDGKIKSDRGYFAEPFEVSEWRAQWVERL
jgi:hypothetical protein